MKRPAAHIEIMTGSGKRITFSQVNSCKVVTSLHTLTDTCTLTVGRKRKWKEQDVTDLTEIIRRGDQMRKMSALIRFHFKVNTDELEDEEWARLWNDLVWMKEEENRVNRYR